MPETKEVKNARSRARKKRLRREHRCESCGKKLEEGYTKLLCPVCNEKHVEGRRRLMARRATQGLCERCGKNQREPGRKSCRECLDAHLDKMWIRRQNRIDDGKCTACGKQLPDGSEFQNCLACRLKDIEYYRKRCERKKEAI